MKTQRRPRNKGYLPERRIFIQNIDRPKLIDVESRQPA